MDSTAFSQQLSTYIQYIIWYEEIFDLQYLFDQCNYEIYGNNGGNAMNLFNRLTGRLELNQKELDFNENNFFQDHVLQEIFGSKYNVTHPDKDFINDQKIYLERLNIDLKTQSQEILIQLKEKKE